MKSKVWEGEEVIRGAFLGRLIAQLQSLTFLPPLLLPMDWYHFVLALPWMCYGCATWISWCLVCGSYHPEETDWPCFKSLLKGQRQKKSLASGWREPSKAGGLTREKLAFDILKLDIDSTSLLKVPLSHMLFSKGLMVCVCRVPVWKIWLLLAGQKTLICITMRSQRIGPKRTLLCWEFIALLSLLSCRKVSWHSL